MQLALHKLFAEAAIALMASGPGSWVGSLTKLAPASQLVPGTVPWAAVVVLLVLWMLVTALPGCAVVVMERGGRWAVTLDGREEFRLWAEWREEVWKLGPGEEDGEEVPGMVGDLQPGGERGFVGLSKVVARGEARRRYGFDRRVCGKGKG